MLHGEVVVSALRGATKPRDSEAESTTMKKSDGMSPWLESEIFPK